MKNLLINTIVIILTTCGLYAQDVKFGFRGGMNLPNIMAGGSNTPVSEGYKSRMATGAGIFTELKINQTVSFRFGVEYSGMGGKKDGMQAMPTQRLITEMINQMGSSLMAGLTPEQEIVLGSMMMLPQSMPYYYANIKNTVKLDYIMLPILVQLGWDIGQSPWNVYVNAGPFVSFLLSAKQVSEGISPLYTDESGSYTLWQAMAMAMPPEVTGLIESTFPEMKIALNDPVKFGETNVTGEMKSANFGITGNVGIRYQHKRSCFFIEGGGNYGFITVQQEDISGSNRLGAGSVMVGYSYSMF